MTIRVRAALLALVIVLGLGSMGPSAGALPTPGLNCQASGTPLPLDLRYVPEPEQTNDFIGFYEWEECMAALSAAYPERIEVKVTAQSYGWENSATMQHDTFPVYMVEVTNEESAVPFEDKLKVLFMLSIHGNEKGGREGGFRAVEDYVRGIGMATQDATGHPGKTLYDLLDQAVLLFLFPNPDGWVHEEPEYYSGAPGLMYTRENGRGTDLNRQFPTIGWQFVNENAGRLAMREPEATGYATALLDYEHIVYAADIHGMLNPADGRVGDIGIYTDSASPNNEENIYGHFILGLISAGRVDPQEMLMGTRLAEVLNDRLNNDPTFAGWSTLPSTGAWGGEFYSWSTVWDTIGYTDSGISGDFFLQDTGLNAPGMNFEMAYNHITFDAAYPGAAQAMNEYHVQTVRQIVRAYLEAAVTNVQTSVESNGKTTAYLFNPTVVTDLDDEQALDGWAAENDQDDPWDISHVDFEAAPNDYFRDLKPFIKDGDQPAVFDELQPEQFAPEKLSTYDNVVVAGSAATTLTESHQGALKQFVEAGGNLVLTDSAFTLLEPLAGIQAEQLSKYAGMALLEDRGHPYAVNSEKLSRQTYEPVPIGYSLEGNNAPVWVVDSSAFESAGGEIVGTVPRDGHTAFGGEVTLGRLPMGSGTISILGAMLPDPTEEFYHPYGLDSYATTYFGNLLFYNMIGAEQVFDAPPIVLENVGTEKPLGGEPSPTAETEADDSSGSTPGPGLVLVTLAVGLGLVVRRRK